MYLSTSVSISQYLKTISDSNKFTGRQYKVRLLLFERFFSENYHFTLDDLLIKRVFKVDIYEVLSKFTSFLVNKKTYTNLTIKYYISTVRNFFEYYDIEISPRKFKLKVKIPKSIKRTKEPLPRELIIKILENCPNIKLKTFVLAL
jgi:integrase